MGGYRAKRLTRAQKRYLTGTLKVNPAEYLAVAETDVYIILENKITGEREIWNKFTNTKD